MKKYIFICFYILLFLAASGVYAQDQKQNSAISQEEMQKLWMEYMTPGWAHKILAEHTGDWKAVMTFWMDPKSEPTKSEGTATAEMILGGRYLQIKFKGTMMGMPYEGLSTDAYDNSKKVFINTWIDNTATGMMYSEGKYDKNTKTITYEGKTFNPMTKAEEKYRETMCYKDKDKMVMEVFSYKDGKEYKSLIVEYTR